MGHTSSTPVRQHDVLTALARFSHGEMPGLAIFSTPDHASPPLAPSEPCLCGAARPFCDCCASEHDSTVAA
jgi:hypothetical protein